MFTDIERFPARFMPKDALQTGHLHLSFITHPPTPALNSLSLLRPSLFPLAAIGIACATHSDSLPALQADFSSTLLDRFPAESTYPVARNCFVFDEGDGTTDINVGEKLSGLVVIPGIMGNKRVYIGTLLADMCSSILGELALVVCAVRSVCRLQLKLTCSNSIRDLRVPWGMNISMLPSFLPYRPSVKCLSPFPSLIRTAFRLSLHTTVRQRFPARF